MLVIAEKKNIAYPQVREMSTAEFCKIVYKDGLTDLERETVVEVEVEGK